MAPDDREVTEATVDVYQGGKLLKTIKPHRDYFLSNEESSTTAGQMSTDDRRIRAAGGLGDQHGLVQGVRNFLVNWVWFGGILLTLGAFLAAWPPPIRDPAILSDGACGAKLSDLRLNKLRAVGVVRSFCRGLIRMGWAFAS